MAKNKEQMVISVDFSDTSNAPTGYANQMIVQHTETEFLVHFYEVLPPPLVGTREEQEITLNKMENLPARCISRIVVAPDKMMEFIKALETNYQKFMGIESFEEDE